MPKAEERLLAVVHALLHRCYKMPFSNNAEVPASLKKELSGAPIHTASVLFRVAVTRVCRGCEHALGGANGASVCVTLSAAYMVKVSAGLQGCARRASPTSTWPSTAAWASTESSL